MIIYSQQSYLYNSNSVIISMLQMGQGIELKLAFRQLLIPIDPSLRYYNQGKVSHEVFTAIGDECNPPQSLSFFKKVIKLYEKLGFTIRPSNRLLLTWDLLIISINIFYFLEIGLLFSFGQQFWQDQLNYALWFHITIICALIIDVLISPLKAFYRDGLLIKDVLSISKSYVQKELWIDILAIFAVLMPVLIRSLLSNILKIVWFTKMGTIKKINRQFQRVTQLNITLAAIYFCLKITIAVFIYSHFMGLGFYLVSLWVYQNNYYGPNTPNICWIYNSQAFSQMILLLRWPDIYIYIIYYSIGIVSTIAYGDIIPKNPLEAIYCIFTYIANALIFGYLMNEIIRFLISLLQYNFDRKQFESEVIVRLKQIRITRAILERVRAHNEQIGEQQQNRNREVQEKILDALPVGPRYLLLATVYKDFLKNLGLDFAIRQETGNFRPITTRSLFFEQFMLAIKEKRFYEGDIIYCCGEASDSEEGHSSYFFTKQIYVGTVILGVGEMPTIQMKIAHQSSRFRSFQLNKPVKGFGYVQFLSGQPRTHWAFAKENCVVFAASRGNIFHHYELMTQREKEIIFQRLQDAQETECLVCQEKHYFLKCPYFFYNARNISKTDIKIIKRKFVRQNRTRIRTQSSWTIFTKIRNIQIFKTRQYVHKVLLHSLFLSDIVDSSFEESEQSLQSQIQKTQLLLDKALGELTGSPEHLWGALEYDQAANYQFYRPYNNIDAIKQQINKSHRRKANVNSFIQNNLLKFFE